MIRVLKQCEREYREFPEDVITELVDTMLMLESGQKLTMPLCRPMPSIGLGVYELRFSDRHGNYRVIYFIKKSDDIWLLHAFQKKTQQTPKQNIDLAKQRLRSIL